MRHFCRVYYVRFHMSIAHQDGLLAQLFRLVHIARSIAMKRALTAVDPDPKLNFWRLVLGNQLDIAVLEWCKVFGSHAEATHWKNIVPEAIHTQYQADLLKDLNINLADWQKYWKEMKRYRDNLVAHHIEAAQIPNFPCLNLALNSSCFHYKYVISELRKLNGTRYPGDLQIYYKSFEEQAQRIATAAILATAEIQEDVR